MRTVLLTSLRAHARRYVAAALAVVIGVTFVVVTAGVTAAARAGIEDGVARPFADATVVTSYTNGPEALRLLDRAAAEGDDAAIVGGVYASVRADDRIVSTEAPVGFVPTTAALRWQELESGAYPTHAGQALADAGDAESAGVRVGDVLTVAVEGATGVDAERVQVEVVGLAAPAGPQGSALYLTADDLRPFADSLFAEAVAWRSSGSVEEQRATITSVDRYAEVVTRDAYVADRVLAANDGVDVIAILLLVFAAIALFVSVLVIANTFAILLAQRHRELALLRCVGATRRELSRSLRTEALVLGAAASLLGLVVGTALAHGIAAVVARLFPDLALGTPSIAPAWYAGAFAVGVAVTVLASWLPTRRTVRIAPIAALRPAGDLDLGTRAGRLRAALGVLLALAGAAALALSVVGQDVVVMIAGGTAVFTGVLVLGPVVVPAIIRLCGGAAGRIGRGTTARLATDNAVRNPRRTAATTASLLVGVTLTTAVLTGMASSRAALNTELDRQHPLDGVLVSSATPLDDTVGTAASVPDVDGVAGVTGTVVRLPRVGEIPVVAPDEEALGLVRGDGITAVADDEILLPWSAGVPDGRRVAVPTAGGGEVRLRAVSVDGFGETALVAPSVLARIAGDGATRTLAVWVRADAEADAEAVAAALAGLAATEDVAVLDGLGNRAFVTLQLDVLTGTVVGLLGIAVVIALLGIANTLGLSVLERARENALLRALGLTRRQLRATLGAEAVLLSVAATLLGTLLGMVFAWVGVQVMVELAVAEAPLVLPWGQLALVVAVSAVAGLLAGVLPARRAARTAPAAGLALE